MMNNSCVVLYAYKYKCNESIPTIWICVALCVKPTAKLYVYVNNSVN